MLSQHDTEHPHKKFHQKTTRSGQTNGPSVSAFSMVTSYNFSEKECKKQDGKKAILMISY